jgi:hypothetical protein
MCLGIVFAIDLAAVVPHIAQGVEDTLMMLGLGKDAGDVISIVPCAIRKASAFCLSL